MHPKSEPLQPTKDEKENIIDDLSQIFGNHEDSINMFELLRICASDVLTIETPEITTTAEVTLEEQGEGLPPMQSE